MKSFTYSPRGVCTRQITFDIDGDIVKNVRFIGGCSGNTQGLSLLSEGMKIDDIINRLKGVDCNMKGTSCPDQLACALMLAKDNMQD